MGRGCPNVLKVARSSGKPASVRAHLRPTRPWKRRDHRLIGLGGSLRVTFRELSDTR
jgi:hypothetical protein